MHLNVQTPQPLRNRRVHRRQFNRFSSSVPSKASRLRMPAQIGSLLSPFRYFHLFNYELFISKFVLPIPHGGQTRPLAIYQSTMGNTDRQPQKLSPEVDPRKS